MITLLGWLGFWLLLSTLAPFVLRRLPFPGAKGAFFARNHHTMALACLSVLTLHGLWALSGRKGWGWGAKLHLKGALFSGTLAWLALLAVFLLALAASRQKPFSRVHCAWVIVLLLFVFYHAWS